VLANWETKDIGGFRKSESVAREVSLREQLSLSTHMAVLWERMVFSFSSNFWYSFGCNTLRETANVSLGLRKACSITIVENLPSSEEQGQSNGVWNPFRLDNVASSDEESRGDIDAMDISGSQ
jgi:hypothetical protein